MHFLNDDSGERVVKGGGGNETVYLNRFYSLKNGDLGSKHIFAGETRVCTKLEKDGGSITSGVPGVQGITNGNVLFAYDRGPGRQIGISRRLPPSSDGTGGTGTTATNPPIEKFMYFYHPDHLGSSSFITDDLGAVYQELEYFPYGETWVEDGGSGQMPMYRFTGKELDPETGLYYFGARYYDPVLSKWIGADPIDRFNAQSPPLSLNLYQYGLNNPVRLVDPTGCEEVESANIFTKIGEWYQAQTAKFGKWVRETFGGAREKAQEAQISQIEQATGEPSTEVRQAESQLMEKVGPQQEQAATEVAQTVVEAAAAKGAGKALAILGGIKETRGLIKISEKRLGHVLERHTVGGALTKNKSIFNAGEDVVGLIRGAEGVSATAQAGGNLQRIVNAGRVIGMDRATGQPTAVYTVITDKAGNLVTTFPGLP